MRCSCFAFCCSVAIAGQLAGQTAVDVPPKAEEKQKQQNAVAKQQEEQAQSTTTVEFTGQQAFTEKDLRSAVKEQLTTVDRYGLTPARADDLAFFVEVFYRKHGYTKATVKCKIAGRDRVQLVINEGSFRALAEEVSRVTGKQETVAAVKSAWYVAKNKIAPALERRGFNFITVE